MGSKRAKTQAQIPKMGQNKPKKPSKIGPESLKKAHMGSKWAGIGPEANDQKRSATPQNGL